MMEKYGAERKTYEVVIPSDINPMEHIIKGSNLNFDEALKLADKFKNAILRPEE